MTTPEQILTAARTAAFAAAKEHDATLPKEENARGFDCGFAWVTVRPARGVFVEWCRKARDAEKIPSVRAQYGNNGSNGGWAFWCTGFHTTQSISTHRAAAEAFAKVLSRNGINAEVGSRLD